MSNSSPPSWLHLSPAVQAAIEDRRAVVALESTVITHGLPRPMNLDLATQMQKKIRSANAEPATIAVLRGQICLGLSSEQIEYLALEAEAIKISTRDLGLAVARGLTGGTTVAATSYIAQRAGLKVFATGGIGGVHRGTGADVSADLNELARSPIAVVCSGAKTILDIPKTLEWLETVGVPTIGWQTDEFPAFISPSSGLPIDTRVDSVEELAHVLHAHWAVGLGGILVCVPCPPKAAIPLAETEKVIEIALSQAKAEKIAGKNLTPYLLARLAENSDGATVRANQALLLNNARIAAQIGVGLMLRD